MKYHRTLATYINNLVQAGFTIKAMSEPVPTKDMLKNIPSMQDEDSRPMFVIISAVK